MKRSEIRKMGSEVVSGACGAHPVLPALWELTAAPNTDCVLTPDPYSPGSILLEEFAIDMKYNDGAEIELGDLVRLGSNLTGVVVGMIPERKFSSNYDPDEWGYLLSGVLLESLGAGLIHQADTRIDFDHFSRAAE